jgi:hypothetical protein
VTSQGSQHARFQRVPLTKNMTIIDAAVAKLGRRDREDAPPHADFMAEKGDLRFPRPLPGLPPA